MNTPDAIKPEQLLAHHLDKTPFALIAWSPDLSVTYWSPRAEALFGWKKEEVLGKHLYGFPLVYEEDIPLVNQTIRGLLNSETDRFTGTNRNLRKDGTLLYCTWHGYVVRDNERQAVSYFSLVEDVTDKMLQEAALKRANERLSLLTNVTNDGIWEWDVVQNKVWCNEAFITTYGYNPQDYVDFYGEWLSRMHPEDRDPFLKSTADAWERKDPNWSGEFRFRMANGSYGIILQKVYFIYDASGNVHKAVGVDINVTHLRQTEAALRLSEEMFSKAFRSSPVPLNILRLSDFVFTDFNEAYCRLIGYDREELIGRPYTDLRIISPVQAKEAADLLYRKGFFRNHRVEMFHKDGSTLHCLISADVLRIDGERYLLTTLFDITEQVNAEAALRFHEQQLELVYNTISDVVFLLEVKEGEQYRFITVNKAFLVGTGLTLEQVRGRPLEEVIPGRSLALVREHYREAIATRRTVQWEEVSPYPAGTKTGIVSVTPVYDAAGVPIRLVGTVHDVTEQKRAAEELRLLASHLQDVREDERTAIAREIHDELGQLLTALKMEVSWLRKIDTLAADQVARRVAAVNTLLDGAINTVRNISSELRPSILDDLGLVEALSWQSREFEKRYHIATAFTTTTPGVELPREVATALFRIYQEALTNVARHARASRIEATLTLLDDSLVLQVTDDGIGFEKEKIAAQKTLGLMGIRERIAAIGGKFDLQTAPGRGTTLTVRAPCIFVKPPAS